MITRENQIPIGKFVKEDVLNVNGSSSIYDEAIFFDLEHYVYKVPICVGVFGCGYYDSKTNQILFTQYMIENSKDAENILLLAKDYFTEVKNKLNKKYIVTFSGNNDFTVINYLFNKNNLNYKVDENFQVVDLQKEYEKEKKVIIGLKSLEKEFDINRESELISGSNLAKTFAKIELDSNYIERMPESKKNKILLYNEQDVISLFHILIRWKRVIKK